MSTSHYTQSPPSYDAPAGASKAAKHTGAVDDTQSQQSPLLGPAATSNHWADMPDADDDIDDFKLGTTVSSSSIEIRQAFVRKVYLVLAIQLLATTGIGAALSMNDSARIYVQTHAWTFWTSFIGSILSMVALFAMRQRYPINIALLSLFTAFEACAVGGIVTFYDTRVVLQALAITTLVFLGLTLFAMQTKYDFTSMAGVLYTVLLAFFFIGLVQFFLPFSRTLDMVYAGVGTLLFSAYILYDTQMICKKLSPDEWVLGVVSLYLDVINLFLNILRILSDAQRD